MPARLRYQACDDKMCYAPSNAQASWTLKVVPSGTSVSAQHGDVLDRIAFGTGEKPARPRPPLRLLPPASSRRRNGQRHRAARQVHPRRQHRRLSRHRLTSSPSSRTPKPASSRRGCSKARGRRDPADRVPWRPGAEPHALRAADDSDQPRHHRRRRAGRLSPARLPPRPHLRRRDGLRLRRARGHRRADRQHVRHHQRVAVVQPWHCGAVRRAVAGDVRRVRDRLLAVLRQHRQRRGSRHVPAGVHHGHRRGAAGRRVRGAGSHPGGAVRQQPLCDRHEHRARAAVLPRHRHGGAMADCRRRTRLAAEAGSVDGAREAGLSAC